MSPPVKEVAVPSGIARSKVLGWLKLSEESVSKDEDEVVDDDDTTFRPARLGLGAKFVQHKKVMASTPVEKGLQRKLGRYQERPDKRRSTNSSQQLQGSSSKNIAVAPDPKVAIEGDSDSDEEEETRGGSKAAAFGKRKIATQDVLLGAVDLRKGKKKRK
ncbi:hypothetical protein CYMTET_54420 [Cymbomonas tetramitiformis]|uniref:Uncharacterized protein n=1 Tax=Cymbomonas tetramitiformis TaxID=36881 RepID=A0AAE0EQR5_9CHLO|nr:hypothetical protein CYMTET_54420 [Cymbomonas tetramitiformis]